MKRFLTMGLIAFALMMGAAQLTTPAKQGGGGTCNCGGTTPVCCRNCNGTFAYCARSYLYCPECPAP